MARILAIGDIHGCYSAVQTLYALLDVRPEDTLVTLGDYTGKGPDSRKVIDWLIQTQHRCNLVTICGNNDLLMKNARKSKKHLQRWLNAGGQETLRSYTPRNRKKVSIEDIPHDHWQFLDRFLQPIFITPSHFFVHANVAPGVALEEQPDSYLFWKKFKRPVYHYSGKTMVCGHTSQKTGLPDVCGRAICIDTKAFHEKGWLSCLDVENNIVYQASQRGKTRQFRLSGIEDLLEASQVNVPVQHKPIKIEPHLLSAEISQELHRSSKGL